MDATDELREAHDELAGFYREYLDGALEKMPVERSMLDLFAELTRAAGLGTEIADVGCGTGRLEPYLAGRGLRPRGVDLSPGMIEVASQDHPEFPYEVGDLRALPFADASLAGVICWWSLLYLAPEDRVPAFAELARVVRPGGHLLTAFKNGDGQRRRRGRRTGLKVEFDTYWLSAGEMERLATDAGFTTVFQGSQPPDEDEPQWRPGYLLARRA